MKPPCNRYLPAEFVAKWRLRVVSKPCTHATPLPPTYVSCLSCYSPRRRSRALKHPPRTQPSVRATTIARLPNCFSQPALPQLPLLLSEPLQPTQPRAASALRSARTATSAKKRVPQAAPASSCSRSPRAHPSSMSAEQHKSGHRRCRLSFSSYTLISD